MTRSIFNFFFFLSIFTSASSFAQSSNSDSNGQPKTVSIQDNGFGMVMSTCQIPSNWEVQSNILTNPSNGQMQQFKLWYVGGESNIAVMKPVFVNNFNRSWNEMVSNTMGNDYYKCSFGEILSNQVVVETNEIRRATQKIGGNAYGYEQAFTTDYDGYKVEGLILGHALELPSGTMLGGYILLAYEGYLQESIEAWRLIASTIKSTPQYLQRQQMAHMQATQRNNAYAYQMNQNNFNKTQQKMKELQAAYDGQNQAFNQDLQDWGSMQNGSTYFPSDQSSDYFGGTTTIDNPWTGIQERADGYYDYYWINQSGKVIGTNDPGFNATDAYGYDWKRANTPGNN